MTYFETYSAKPQTVSYEKTKSYKAEHVSETYDNSSWRYAQDDKAAIKNALKLQNTMNGIAKRIEVEEDLDTVLLQENN